MSDEKEKMEKEMEKLIYDHLELIKNDPPLIINYDGTQEGREKLFNQAVVMEENVKVKKLQLEKLNGAITKIRRKRNKCK